MSVIEITVAPTLTAQPQNFSALVGQSATFGVTATGSTPLTYQWSRKSAGGSFTDIAGATSSAYVTPALALLDSGAKFHVRVSNVAGAITSNDATLSVSQNATAPVITTQPLDRTATLGQSVLFTVQASGTGPLSYHWQRNGGILRLENGPPSTLTSVMLADSGAKFRCVVSNSAGSATSTEAS